VQAFWVGAGDIRQSSTFTSTISKANHDAHVATRNSKCPTGCPEPGPSY